MRVSLLSALFAALTLVPVVGFAQTTPGGTVRPNGVRPATTGGTTNAAAAPSVPTGTNVAVVDIAHIFDNFGRFKAQMDDIKSDMDQFEAYIKSEQEKLKGLSERLKGLEPTSPDFKGIEEQIVTGDSNLRLQIARQRKEFLDREARVYFDHYNEVVGHVESIARQNSIGLVLRFSNKDMNPEQRETVLQGVNRAVVYSNGIDITPLVLDRLTRFTPPPRTANGTTPAGPALPGARPPR